MRSSAIVTILFALGVVASPMVKKRAMVTVTDVFIHTDVVMFGDPVPTASSSSSAPPPPKITPPGTGAIGNTDYEVQADSSPSSSATPTTSSTPAPSDGPLDLTPVPGLLSGTQQYADIMVSHHNVHRANHTAKALTWNSTLATWAQNKADTCVWNEKFLSGTDGAGVNIAQGTALSNVAAVVTEQWYNNELENFPGYGNPNPDMSKFVGWGHFSQVAWPDTEQVGCATKTSCAANCGDDGSDGCAPAGDFTVCYYYPPGNYATEYNKLHAPMGQPMISAN